MYGDVRHRKAQFTLHTENPQTLHRPQISVGRVTIKSYMEYVLPLIYR